MDTWEVVLILILVTVALVVLSNQNISLDLIQILDNSLFQLVVLSLTLAVAIYSPPVAVVGIISIVIVYYIRNLSKVQLLNVNERTILIEEETNPNPPRITITEETTTIETTKTKLEISDDGDYSENTRDEDLPSVENALSEHESRISLDSPDLLPKEFKMSGTVPVYDSKMLDREDFENPRSSNTQPEYKDHAEELYGVAPTTGTPNYLTNDKSFEADIFSDSPVSPNGFNESALQPSFRPYDKNDGQYAINELRPYTYPQKQELADYIPGNDQGNNTFNNIGVSIDDKITNLTKGISVSSAPPPNFDQVSPSPMKYNIA